MTDKELISKLQELRQIKPRKNWVVLTKNQILGGAVFENKKVFNAPTHREVLSNVLSLFFQRKLAYVLATFLFLAVGVFGFMKYVVPSDSNVNVKVAQQSSPADIIAIKSNVKDFKEKSKNFSQVAKFNPRDISSAVKEVKDAAQELTDAIKKDPQLAKEVALDINNNKTYLDVNGDSDLKDTLNDLYKTTVDTEFKDLEKTTLTPEQQSRAQEIKNSYDKGEYPPVVALQNILILLAASGSK